MRRIGGWVSGKARLGASLREAKASGYTAAQTFLTAPNKVGILHDGMDFGEIQTLSQDLSLYVHAPYVMALFPPLVSHSRQLAPLKMLARHAAHLGAAGLVLHLGMIDEYGDTALRAARQMIDDIQIQVLIENPTDGLLKPLAELIVRLRDSGSSVALCLDTARAWAAGDDTLFGDDRQFESLTDRYLTPALGLLHLNNSPSPFGTRTPSPYAPLLHGQIPFKRFESLVKQFPKTPVILERTSPVQTAVDRAVVTALDCNLTHTLAALKQQPVSGALTL